MADIGVAILDDNLPPAGEVGATDEFYILADAKLRQIAFAHDHAPRVVIGIFYQSQPEAVKRKFSITSNVNFPNNSAFNRWWSYGSIMVVNARFETGFCCAGNPDPFLREL